MSKQSEGLIRDHERSILAALLKTVTRCPQQAAIRVLQKYPSFQHAIRADKADLAEIVGIDGAEILLVIPEAVTALTREVLPNPSSFVATLNAVKSHFCAMLNGRRNETFSVIYLDTRNRLIGEDVWAGTIDRTAVYPREILRRVILLDASTVFIAHNHPSGDPTPSDEDFKITERIQSALELIDVLLFDHLIYGEGSPYSFRENFHI